MFQLIQFLCGCFWSLSSQEQTSRPPQHRDNKKKTQTEGILDMENLGKGMGTTETNISNRIQELEEKI